MELSSPTNTSSATFKNEAENETPSLIQPPKLLSFSNGVLKRLHHHHSFHHHAVVVTYKECLKNHAAAIGGHAVDGCGEFMAANNINPNDPTTLKCAACGCHRNFHRREPENPITSPPPSTTIPALEYHPHHRHHPNPPPPPPLDHNSGDHSSPSSASPPPISSSYYPPPPHMLLSLTSAAASGGLHGGGGLFSGDPKSENNKNSPPPHMLFSLTGVGGGGYSGGGGLFSGDPKSENTKNSPISAPDPNSNSRKRFRTKFTPDQKEKMVEFAEKVGWRFQKKDEELITRTCNEIGIDKGVLKVWMHNNKNTLGKKDHNFDAENGNGFGGNEYQHHLHSQEDGGDTSNSNNGGRSLNQLHQILSSTDNGILGTHVMATTTATTVNGSSSS